MKNVKNVKTNKLVYLKWIDSRGVTSRWEFLEEMEELTPCYCESVGFIVHETKEIISIVQNVSDDGMQLIGVMTIPICAITERKEIIIDENKCNGNNS